MPSYTGIKYTNNLPWTRLTSCFETCLLSLGYLASWHDFVKDCFIPVLFLGEAVSKYILTYILLFICRTTLQVGHIISLRILCTVYVHHLYDDCSLHIRIKFSLVQFLLQVCLVTSPLSFPPRVACDTYSTCKSGRLCHWTSMSPK